MNAVPALLGSAGWHWRLVRHCHGTTPQTTGGQTFHAARPRAQSRSGFSLMEVLLATSILLGSVIVLQELAHIGRTQANRSQELAKAELLCLDKLNEMLAGLAPLETVADSPIKEQPGWIYSVAVEPVEETGLVAVTVGVTRDDEPTDVGGAERPHSTRFTLVRWVRGPAGSWEPAAGGAAGLPTSAFGPGLKTRTSKPPVPPGGVPKP